MGDQLRRALERAEHRGLFDLASLQGVLDAHPRRPGRRRLVTLVAELARQDGRRTRSDVEALFLQLCTDHDLPRPQVNRHADGRERDFTFGRQRLLVEVEGVPQRVAAELRALLKLNYT